MDLTVVAYATLALSVFVSAVKMGGWILNADPRVIISAGRWALALLPALALAVLVWLVASGRWTAAMLLAAFLLPIFVQAAPRWRVLFAPLNAMKSGIRPFASDLGGSIVPRGSSPAREPPDMELVEQSVAVLHAYLQQTGLQSPEQTRSQIEHKSVDRHSGSAPIYASAQAFGSVKVNGSGNGGLHMSTQEAFDVLGLEPTPSPREIRAAHRRLAQLVDPEQGGSHYLLTKIDEARDVLLGE
jgi:hypothetical protein